MRYLVTLYESGTVTAAAEKLHISQPSLTNHLSRMESKLGSSLFLRGAKGLEPTPLGKELYARSRQMLQQWQEFDQELKLLAGAEIGHIHLVCGPVIEQEILPSALSTFLQHFPGINTSIEVLGAELILGKVLDQQADIAVGAMPIMHDLPVVSLPGGSAEVSIYARAGHPLLQATSLRASDVFKYPYVTPQLPAALQPWFVDEEQQPAEPQVVASSYKLLKLIAANSDACITGVDFLFEQEREQGTLCKLPVVDAPMWQASIIMSRASAQSKAIRQLAKLIQQELQKRTSPLPEAS
jgi:DNA-binding transcriptional LysR family regulator